VDVLRHHPSPHGSGDHRSCGYQAVAEVTLKHDPKPKILVEYIYCFHVCAICVVCGHSSIAVPMFNQTRPILFALGGCCYSFEFLCAPTMSAVKLVNTKLNCAS
jgi:hypothetical protein